MDSAELGFNRQPIRPIDFAVWLLKVMIWLVCLPAQLVMGLWRRR